MLENVSTYKKHSTVRAISIGPSEELRRDRMGQTRGDQVEDDPLGLQLQCTGKGSLKRTDLQLTVGRFSLWRGFNLTRVLY